MLPDVVLTILLFALPVVAWRTWLALFPGISLHSDYGIRGGWFGTQVTFRGATASSSRYGTPLDRD